MSTAICIHRLSTSILHYTETPKDNPILFHFQNHCNKRKEKAANNIDKPDWDHGKF